MKILQNHWFASAEHYNSSDLPGDFDSFPREKQIHLLGSLLFINNALQTLTYHGLPDSGNQTDTIKLFADDLGFSGHHVDNHNPVALNASASVQVVVKAKNDAPRVAVAVSTESALLPVQTNEDSCVHLNGFSVSDADISYANKIEMNLTASHTAGLLLGPTTQCALVARFR